MLDNLNLNLTLMHFVFLNVLIGLIALLDKDLFDFQHETLLILLILNSSFDLILIKLFEK